MAHSGIHVGLVIYAIWSYTLQAMSFDRNSTRYLCIAVFYRLYFDSNLDIGIK